jgi:hypothetical protein
LKRGDVGCGEAVENERGVRMGFCVCSGEDICLALVCDDLGVVLIDWMMIDG